MKKFIQVSPARNILVDGKFIAKDFKSFTDWCIKNRLNGRDFKNWPFPV